MKSLKDNQNAISNHIQNGNMNIIKLFKFKLIKDICELKKSQVLKIVKCDWPKERSFEIFSLFTQRWSYDILPFSVEYIAVGKLFKY